MSTVPGRWKGGTALVGVALVMGACAAGSRGADGSLPGVCEPMAETPVEVEPEALTGTYSLVLVATVGPRRESSAQGSLELEAQDPELRELVGPGELPIGGATQPLVGTFVGALGEVGAQIAGDPASPDPEAPGVALLAIDRGADRPDELLLRLGSEANVRGRVAFDEAFTVLWIHHVDERGFFGGWESGGGAEPEAAGHFCAFRS